MKYAYLMFCGLLMTATTRADMFWPTDDAWIPLYTDGSALADASNDTGNKGHPYLDIVGDATYASGYLHFLDADTNIGATDDMLLLRLRLNGTKNKMKGAWQVFFETDGNDGVEWVLQLTSDDLAKEGELQFGTSGGETKDSITFGSLAWSGNYEGNVHWTGEATSDGSRFGGDDDYFLDLAMPWNEFSGITGIATNSGSFRVAAATSQQSGQLSDGSLSDFIMTIPISNFTDFENFNIVIPEPAAASLLVGAGCAILLSRRIFGLRA
ncbi:MAG: hypothetical protein JXR25_10890 [Pontiellaceae bacterium]|nr:hypothetical protein [Pontiellaceae bacterium]MBN2785326.1 hypothetical protein [Pontiellaceae bacterium]